MLLFKLSIADLVAVIEILQAKEHNSDSRGDQFKYSIRRQQIEDHLAKRLEEFGIDF